MTIESDLKEVIELKSIPIDYSWSFSGLTIKDTAYISHGYYTYPAKFIPQLASRLINKYTNKGDVVVDPFMGSGTTILESIVSSRKGIGTDINDIAYLVAKVKTTPLNRKELLQEYIDIESELEYRLNWQLDNYIESSLQNVPKNSRIDYWFKEHQKNKLAVIWSRILEVSSCDIQDFFKVGFAQILKSCSIWMQKSIKPTRDLKKKNYDPLQLFLLQIKKMIKQHQELEKILAEEVKENIVDYRTIKNCDARNLPCEDEKATLIVTSPPYVTSYEYADLHQLASLWFEYTVDLTTYRNKFIGSSYKEKTNIELKSKMGEEIVKNLTNKKALDVQIYFSDMLQTFTESKRVLKVGGKICIVIGNTQFKGVDILNAEVFKEQLENIGFKTIDIIHREIPSKMLPSTRNPKTGQFTKASNESIKLAYPTEYILVMEKL